MSLLLASPDVPIVSCAAVDPLVASVLSAIKVHGVPAVARASALVSLMLWV